MSSSGTDLVGMLKTTPRPSVSRGSMMNKQIKGLTVDEVKESLFGLLPDYTDFVVGDLFTPRFLVYLLENTCKQTRK